MNINEIYSLFTQSTGVSTDSRKIEKGNIYIALKGENFNGNKFAQSAINQGAVAAFVDDKELENLQQNIFFVENGLQTLQQLAHHHRKQFNIPFIGLTGSNGKTTTKELIAACLEKKYNVAFTHGNLNNHIGVPLTLLSIDGSHQIAVIEMGANHQKEIEQLCEIAEPDFGYITNFGKAHLEGFGGFEGVIAGKSELYKFLQTRNKIAFANADDPIQLEKTDDINRITFGFQQTADYNFESFSNHGKASIKFQNIELISNLSGNYNEVNIAAATTIALHFDVEIGKIKNAIAGYFPKINRSQEIQQNGKKILLDAYNANPSSMQAAFANFTQLDGIKAVILGDMFELGETSFQEHHDVARMATQLDFEHIYLIGKEFNKIKIANPKIHQFADKELFLNFIQSNPISADRLLIKGSRGMALESLLDKI